MMEDAGYNPAEKKKEAGGERKQRKGWQPEQWTTEMPDIIRRNKHTNMPAYNDGEMDEEKDGEKDALAELAHTGQRKRPK